MEILNNIWTALTTENQLVLDLMYIPLAFIEVYISMLLFLKVLNINSTKKQKILYVVIASVLAIVCTTFVKKPYSNIITIIAVPIMVMLVFKVNLLKGILAEFIPTIFITIFELIVTRLSFLLFNLPYEVYAKIPLYRFIATFTIYILLFITYIILNKLHFNIHIFDKISKKNKYLIITNIVIATIVIFIQMYLIGYYNDKLPTFIIFINVISLIAYFSVSIFSLVKTMKLEKTTEDLEQQKLYNKTLQILHDNIRAFKHDFANIIAGIGGYIETDDINGLKKYYKQLLEDCNQVNNLSSLSPDSINNPAVYAVLANKYYKADSLGIKINLETFIDFNNLHMDIYEFTRILGILMDNAIEASCECKEKLINVTIRDEESRKRQLLTIENTYSNKDVNIDKIYEKGFSTKPKNTGLGLWEVDKIISKHKNITRFTSKTDEFFKQQLEIYDE